MTMTEEEERMEELAAKAYSAYWERTMPKHLQLSPFKRQGDEYREDWKRVVRAILGESHG